MTALEAIELEMAYTSYQQSCKDPQVGPKGDLRECRRPHGHTGPHASGHGEALILWGRTA